MSTCGQHFQDFVFSYKPFLLQIFQSQLSCKAKCDGCGGRQYSFLCSTNSAVIDNSFRHKEGFKNALSKCGVLLLRLGLLDAELCCAGHCIPGCRPNLVVQHILNLVSPTLSLLYTKTVLLSGPYIDTLTLFRLLALPLHLMFDIVDILFTRCRAGVACP